MPNKSVASQTLEDSACGLLVPPEEFVCPNCDTRFLHPKNHICGIGTVPCQIKGFQNSIMLIAY